ncbi:hypothetical protein CKM354_000149100 [Cercospora kikuchii]|uniref:Uncharacterized protein n=1 Tax=Cercospora kikuchii TaxID=84275 RepID=A0A9P3CDL3_9PEZI|nr:uncharacterized protein CKM354_000149100 [Cercospora kikuchii]GIZ38065.1 hypothetical protein CKM354_000149100 [Cercospora kikuchii]
MALLSKPVVDPEYRANEHSEGEWVFKLARQFVTIHTSDFDVWLSDCFDTLMEYQAAAPHLQVSVHPESFRALCLIAEAMREFINGTLSPLRQQYEHNPFDDVPFDYIVKVRLNALAEKVRLGVANGQWCEYCPEAVREWYRMQVQRGVSAQA